MPHTVAAVSQQQPQVQTTQPSQQPQDQISQAIAQANANALAAVAASQQQQQIRMLQNRATDVTALGMARPALASLFPGSNPLASLHANPLLGSAAHNLLNPQLPLAAGLPAAHLMNLGLGQHGAHLPSGISPTALGSSPLFNPAAAGLPGANLLGGPAGQLINPAAAAVALPPAGNQLAMQQQNFLQHQQQLLTNLLQPPPQPQ